MKKALSRIVSLLLVLCLVTALVPAVFAADENEVQILFLDTSDVHGQQFATDYTQDASLSGTHYQSMTRVATYVKQQRAEYKNVFLGPLKPDQVAKDIAARVGYDVAIVDINDLEGQILGASSKAVNVAEWVEYSITGAHAGE